MGGGKWEDLFADSSGSGPCGISAGTLTELTAPDGGEPSVKMETNSIRRESDSADTPRLATSGNVWQRLATSGWEQLAPPGGATRSTIGISN